jgi:general secretion pathway protein M
MNVWTRRCSAVLLLTLLVLVAAMGLVYQHVWTRYEKAIGILEPRLQRIEGTILAESSIRDRLDAINLWLTPLIHPYSTGVQTQIQQKVRQLTDGSGLTLVTSQAVYEEGATQDLARVRMTATVVGEWSKIVVLLEALHAQRPLLWVRSSAIMRENGGQSADPQVARLIMQIEAPIQKVLAQ